MPTTTTTPIFYINTSDFVYNNGLIRVQDNNARLIDNEPFSVANPTILANFIMQAANVSAFAEDAVYSGGDAVQYILVIDGLDYYWGGAAWVSSDGSYAQSNSASVINTNCSHASLATILTVSGSELQIKAFLHSNNGTTSPTLTSISITYGFIAIRPSNPAQCVVYCYLEDILGGIIGDTQNAKFSVQQKDPFIYGSFVIAPFVESTAFDSTGYAQLILDETQTPGINVLFSISYQEDDTIKQINFIPCMIPNAGSAAVTSFTTFAARSTTVSGITSNPSNNTITPIESQIIIANNVSNSPIPPLSFSPISYSVVKLEYTIRRQDTGEYFREDGYIVLDWNALTNLWSINNGAYNGSSGPISGVSFSVTTGVGPSYLPTVTYTSDLMSGGGTYIGTMRYKVVNTFLLEN